MNEAAILAARRNLQQISKEEISDALEKIIAGPEKKGAVVSDAKKKLVAYHEVSQPVSFLQPATDSGKPSSASQRHILLTPHRLSSTSSFFD